MPSEQETQELRAALRAALQQCDLLAQALHEMEAEIEELKKTPTTPVKARITGAIKDLKIISGGEPKTWEPDGIIRHTNPNPIYKITTDDRYVPYKNYKNMSDNSRQIYDEFIDTWNRDKDT